MTRKILVADLLCGAGGSSTGCARALAQLGLKMELVCVNHWPVAIETHKRNHPEARHYVQDISACRPNLLVPEGYLDLLMASPTCTHHSVARGGKPTSDQQRSDPWHIVTWLTELRVKRIIIENVWEFTGWGPVDARNGRPIPSRKGEYFRAWIDTLRRLGFEPEWRKLNAADYGDATTRQRFILMARSDRRPVSWPVPTHCRKPDGQLALLPTVKPWKPARDIIDWNIRGKSIFGRKKPLAPKTLARIYAGAVKFHWPEPFLVILRNHMAGQSVDQPLPVIAAGGTHIGLAEPVIVNGRKNNKARSVSEPIPTLDTKGGVWLGEALIVSPRHGREGAGPQPRCASDPLPTITAGGSQVAVVEPFVLSQLSKGAPRSTDSPMPTITTGSAGSERQGCARPMLIEPLVTSYYGASTQPQGVSDPLPTVTTKDRFGIVIPITHAGGEDRVRDVSEPLPTVTGANRGELAVITAQHGERDGQSPRIHSVDDPAPTIAATGHIDLAQGVVEATFDGERYDILFRMLEPHELAAAMGFTTDESAYQFAGTKTEQIKQIGNAVSVAKMAACVGAIMADAAPKRKPAEVPAPMPVRGAVA